MVCSRVFAAILSVLAILIMALGPAAAEVRDCAGCHSEPRFSSEFANSVHGRTGCLSCHKISDLSKHVRGEEEPSLISCGTCHAKASKDYGSDAHYLKLDLRCQDCHRDIHTLQKPRAAGKIAIDEKCTQCHPQEEYAAKGHGAAVLRGNNDAASCADCHGLHGIPAFEKASPGGTAQARIYYATRCIACHDDPGLVKRNKLAPDIVRHYEATYHGKVLKMGHPERVAGCADCHVSHNILPRDNPESNFTPEGRTAMCGRCHSGFHPEFANYIAHPDYEDPNEYPVLHITYILMIILIVGVFLFFWTHTILWWRKAWSEEYARKKACEPSPYKCEGDNVERFRPLYRVMHVLLILSFLTLVMTGIPLKYPAADWARTLVRFWGGAYSAGIFHRLAATVLTLLFLYTILMSIKFLFPGGRVKGWLGRLFGPDSLFPNLKDLQDIKGMFLWFFNKGKMPKFDRWTYWEKFDFLAVFWGMFAIGLSGFMLWFPEKFSYISPGWFINLAALVHSEEALLAALFIFTVHFFNNHIVPNKFPLEPNIFTGRNTIEQMKHERELEYDRLASSGNLEKIKRPSPGPNESLAWRIFGFVSTAIGIFLTLLILWAVAL